jgi:hypothetical protein
VFGRNFGNDIITDFNASEGDTLDFSALEQGMPLLFVSALIMSETVNSDGQTVWSDGQGNSVTLINTSVQVDPVEDDLTPPPSTTTSGTVAIQTIDQQVEELDLAPSSNNNHLFSRDNRVDFDNGGNVFEFEFENTYVPFEVEPDASLDTGIEDESSPDDKSSPDKSSPDKSSPDKSSSDTSSSDDKSVKSSAKIYLGSDLSLRETDLSLRETDTYKVEISAEIFDALLAPVDLL